MYRAPRWVVSVGAGTAVALLVLTLGGRRCEAQDGPCQTLYVRLAGSDAHDGCSPVQALRSITQAAALAKPGDRIVVGPGTYKEGAISPSAFGRVSFVADRRGTLVGEAAGDVVIDATSASTGFEFNHNVAMTVDGFVIFGAGIGIYVKSQSDQVLLSNNIVSNCVNEGIYIQDSKNAVIFNNLVYNNGHAGVTPASGIRLAGEISAAPGARIINNTVYGNGDRGIFFAGTLVGSPGGLVLNNALKNNPIAGIQVNTTSRTGYRSAGNVTADRFASRTPSDITDVQDDPAFVNPAGADGVLGGSGYADDDFHLSQTGAGQSTTSPAVNVGSDDARRLKLARATTRTDGRPDTGVVDAGYHYGNFSPPPLRPDLRIRYKPLYVSAANGSDTNDGATVSGALQTVGRALQLVQPGHRVLLLGGTYREGELSPANSGAPERDILIQGLSGASIDASGFERGILISHESNIDLVGLDITGAPTGIEVRNGSSAVRVERCRVHQNSRRGIYVNNAQSVSVNASRIEQNGSIGVQVEAEAEVDISATSMRANAETGLWVLNGSTVTVSNSQFTANPTQGVLVSNSTVAISGGTISGGKDGGARFKDSSTATLTNVALVGNDSVGVQVISSGVTVSGGRVEGSLVGVDAFLDPISHASNQLTLTGTQVCGCGGPGVHAQDTSVVLTDVTLCQNMAEGLRQTGGDVHVSGARILQNLTKGMAIDEAKQVEVENSLIGRNEDNGLQISGAAALSISGSVVYSNHGDGMTILDADAPQIWNNLVYANTSTGILLSGDVSGSPRAQVLNNTIYGNGNRGVLIGGSNDKPPSPTATVLRNIFQGNGVAGIQVNQLSLPGYTGDYNLSTDPYFVLTPVGAHDVLADPLLVKPAGTDGVLGGAGAADDDFHLSQRSAGQSATSPAVDAGGAGAASVRVQTMTTRTDRVPDSGIADLGYHYRQ